MAEGFPLWDTPDKVRAKIKDDIEEYGWSGISVFQEGSPDDDDFKPTFSYTIGFSHSLGHPELVCTGLRGEIAHSIFWAVWDLVKKGERMLPWAVHEGLAQNEYPVTFLPVSAEVIKDRWMRGASAHYGGPDQFHAYQLMFTDLGYVWPWEEGFDEQYRPLMPLLGDLEWHQQSG